jgi:membrane protein DedA with SNARE-associated domain
VPFTLVGTVVGLIVTVLSTIGLAGLFALMIVESFGVPPLPSEVILPFAGFLVAEGTLPLFATIAVAMAGALVGSFAGYAVGRWGRERITGVGLGFLRVEERHIARMDAFFARWGEVTVVVARLLPVVHAYISFAAGTARMNPTRFGMYTFAGATPYALALLYVGFVLRSHWELISSYFGVLDYVLIPLIALAVVYLGLLIVGVLAPGWPPRRRRTSAGSPGPAGAGEPRP